MDAVELITDRRIIAPQTIETAIQASESDLEIKRTESRALPLSSPVSNEAAVLSRAYSPLRARHKKWVLYSEALTCTPGTRSRQGLVKVPRHETTEYYSAQSLVKRAKVRSYLPYQTALADLWRLLNPFHLRAISQKLWFSFNVFLYTQFATLVQVETALAWATHDTEVDFVNIQGLDFEGFSSSLFEFLDSTTKSKLSSEYTKLLKAILDRTSDQTWFKRSDLHCKLHIRKYSSPYSRPMLPQLKSLRENYVLIEEVARSHSPKPRLLDPISRTPVLILTPSPIYAKLSNFSENPAKARQRPAEGGSNTSTRRAKSIVIKLKDISQ
jgi:hypothetical protein